MGAAAARAARPQGAKRTCHRSSQQERTGQAIQIQTREGPDVERRARLRTRGHPRRPPSAALSRVPRVTAAANAIRPISRRITWAHHASVGRGSFVVQNVSFSASASNDTYRTTRGDVTDSRKPSTYLHGLRTLRSRAYPSLTFSPQTSISNSTLVTLSSFGIVVASTSPTSRRSDVDEFEAAYRQR